jgi:tetratricopeptide (TPR) repeat protein
MFKTILVASLLIAACLVAVVILRKIPQLSLIEPETVSQLREEEIKKHLLITRLQRKFEAIKRFLKILEQFFKKKLVRIKERWERLKYLEKQSRIEKQKDKIIEELLSEAERKSEESPGLAEKIYLEIIKIDRKNIPAYEGLVRLYSSQRKWEEAKEILKFLLKSNPQQSIGYLFQLAKIEFENDNLRQAIKLVRQIVEEEGARDPRYLDFLIELAILDNNPQIAVAGLEILKEINPENAKISEFEERIKELKIEKKMPG